MGARQLRRLAQRLGAVQIDSVNVVCRAHYLPAFSRLGHHDRGDLDRLVYARPRALFEYWGHEASLLPVETQPLMRWRMERAERGEGIYGGLATFGRERATFIEEVRRQVEARGPLAASELDGSTPGAGGWWGWSDGKRALEWLFWAGRLTTRARRASFERVYDLTGRVLPRAVVEMPTPTPEEAQRALLTIAARAMGVATERDLRDYFRLGVLETRARVAELVEAGGLVPVGVEGWPQPAFLDPAARLPRRVDARALLAPFDPLVWERARAERLFGFRYRLEIYTPAARRQHGYYVLPFLFGDRLAARVDLKSDRAAGCLRVLAAHPETGCRDDTVEALAGELAALARWLGLERVVDGTTDSLRTAMRRDAAHTPLAFSADL